MAVVYILYSYSLNKFYTGSCNEHLKRLEQHLSEYFPKSFTAAAKDWVIYLTIENLEYLQSRNVEAHIKRMKSKKYIENLKRFREMREKLVSMYR